MTFPIYNDGGVVIAVCSTRKKAFSRAKQLIRRGTRYAAVPYLRRGIPCLREYAGPA